MELTATLRPDSLTIETTIFAEDLLPVSFGFHPYFGIASLPRDKWRLELPAMRKLVVDDRGIPTGKDKAFDRFDTPLADLNLDAGFTVLDEHPAFSLSGDGRRITLEFLENYRYAQISAPRGKDFVALEPMTAPTSALTSRQGLRLVEPGNEFRAAFCITGTDASVKVVPLSSTAWMKPRGSRNKAKGARVERAYDDVAHLANLLVSLRSSWRVGGRLGRALRGS